MKYLALFLTLNAAYLVAFPSATLFYAVNVLLHLGAGAALLVLLLRQGRSITSALFLASAVPAAYLIVKGNTTDHRVILYLHIVLAAAGMAALWWKSRDRWVAVSLLALVAARLVPAPAQRIVNPTRTPLSMEEEGAGPKGRFWPSAIQSNVDLVPSSYFLDSDQCGTCHKDIYEQWKSSVHHFASFNNRFYAASIERMQEVQGSTQPSRWCAGCHDHAVLLSGRWDKPIKDQLDTPEAQAGLACVSCHSIVAVRDSMGNGAFDLEYNWLHRIAASRNKYVQAFDHFLIYTNPEPHRRAFLKPFHKDNSEFCASCHKVHLDVPVNNYRWIRGFNDYDNWQASGVSGKGARSFYYPEKPATCGGCHMPLVKSADPGNRDGMVHSHRFPGANTAVAHVNKDQAQMDATLAFLKSGFIGVDIFSASPVEETGVPMMRRAAGEQAPSALSSFAVGEEAESAGQVFLREVGQVAAPLNRTPTRFQPGSTVRVDVVVRTKKIGHFFPGGTVDAFDVWLEVEAKDANGDHVFWSGQVEDKGKGPVERGAHFYRSYQLDGDGNHIDKRNAFETRSVLYVRMIPPGAADTAHYRIRIPKGVKGPVTLQAKLNYRKFAHSYTQFAFANQKEPPPDLPVVTLAESRTQLAVAAPGEATEWQQVIQAEDYQRWNDWGIGMLLQGDLRGAQYAFQKVIEAKPDYADGPVNVARALIQEGETEAARPLLGKALQLAPGLARAHFFQAMVEKAAGNYDAAIEHLREAEAQYPEDRVVLNQLGRLLFLKRQYADAAKALERVLAIDPEDLQAHYGLMLCYRGLNQPDRSDYHAKLFQRFKADESSQTITAKPRQLHPEDNNERQMIHDHESIPLAVKKPS
jgi:tetratricopeptide (TPR) repeat protein